MNNIINFEDHSRKYKFEEQIISTFAEKNKFYEFMEDGETGVAFLHHNYYTYVFFCYVPRGETTELLNLDESFSGIISSAKISQGEWFVDRIVSLKKEVAYKTLPLIYSKDKPKGWLMAFKQQIFKNLTESERYG